METIEEDVPKAIQRMWSKKTAMKKIIRTLKKDEKDYIFKGGKRNRSVHAGTDNIYIYIYIYIWILEWGWIDGDDASIVSIEYYIYIYIYTYYIKNKTIPYILNCNMENNNRILG